MHLTKIDKLLPLPMNPLTIYLHDIINWSSFDYFMNKFYQRGATHENLFAFHDIRGGGR